MPAGFFSSSNFQDMEGLSVEETAG